MMRKRELAPPPSLDAREHAALEAARSKRDEAKRLEQGRLRDGSHQLKLGDGLRVNYQISTIRDTTEAYIFGRTPSPNEPMNETAKATTIPRTVQGRPVRNQGSLVRPRSAIGIRSHPSLSHSVRKDQGRPGSAALSRQGQGNQTTTSARKFATTPTSMLCKRGAGYDTKTSGSRKSDRDTKVKAHRRLFAGTQDADEIIREVTEANARYYGSFALWGDEHAPKSRLDGASDEMSTGSQNELLGPSDLGPRPSVEFSDGPVGVAESSGWKIELDTFAPIINAMTISTFSMNGSHDDDDISTIVSVPSRKLSIPLQGPDHRTSEKRSLAQAQAQSHSQPNNQTQAEGGQGSGKGDGRDISKYLTDEARFEFFTKFNQVSRQYQSLGDHEDDASGEYLDDNMNTPRQRYFREILRQHAIPFPALMRSTSKPNAIDLTGLGLGDDVMLGLVASLSKLPNLQELNLCDNRLTDRSLEPICENALKCKQLTALDLSSNKIDNAAHKIFWSLRRRDCKLRTLKLREADIDDDECATFMDAVRRNKSLTYLDVSHNLIGRGEELNAVMPEYLTGGEAIAEMIEKNESITHLDLSWNFLRGDSAEQVGEMMRHNHHIKTLILAHNAFANIPTQLLGESLTYNKTIEHIDLSYNGVTPRAAMLIASTCRANVSLKELNLNGNQIGRHGAEALMKTLVSSNEKHNGVTTLQVTMANCDIDYEDKSLFSQSEPAGQYELNLRRPYDAMVAHKLLRLANTQTGCRFKQFQFSDEEFGPFDTIELKRTPPKESKSKWTTKASDAVNYIKTQVDIIRGWDSTEVSLRDDDGHKVKFMVNGQGHIDLHIDNHIDAPEIFNDIIRIDEDGGILTITVVDPESQTEKSTKFKPVYEADLKRAMDLSRHIGLQPLLDPRVMRQLLSKVFAQLHLEPVAAVLDSCIAKLAQYADDSVSTGQRVQGTAQGVGQLGHKLFESRGMQAPGSRRTFGAQRTGKPDSGFIQASRLVKEASTESENRPQIRRTIVAQMAPKKANKRKSRNRASVSKNSDRKSSSASSPSKKASGDDLTQSMDNIGVKRLRPTAEDLGNDEDELSEFKLMELLFAAFFETVDVDGSLCVDAYELTKCLEMLGAQHLATPAAIRRIMASHDIDGSGSFELAEFQTWAAGALLKEKPTVQGDLIDAYTGKKYYLPGDGHLKIDFEAEPMPPDDSHVAADEGIENLLNNISGTSELERQTMLDKAMTCSEMCLTAVQAQQIVDKCMENRQNNALDAVIKLLPQMKDANAALELVDGTLTHIQKIKLRVALKNSFGPLLGNPTGHYLLDLTDANDRLAARKIAELANYEKRIFRAKANTSDTSQKGNGEMYRNERLNGKKIELTPAWFGSMPTTGTLEFDYVSIRRPPPTATPISMRRFASLVQIMKIDEIEFVKNHFQNDGSVEVKRRNTTFFANQGVKASGPPALAAMAEIREDGEDGGSNSDSDASSSKSDTTESTTSHGDGGGFDVPRCILTKDVVAHWRKWKASSDENLNYYPDIVTGPMPGGVIPDAAKQEATKDGNEQQETNEGRTATANEENDKKADDAPKGKTARKKPKQKSVKKQKLKALGKLAKGLKIQNQEEGAKETGETEKEAAKGASSALMGGLANKLAALAMTKRRARETVEKERAKNTPPSSYAFVYSKLIELQIMIIGVYLSSQQAAYIVKKFPKDDFCQVEAACIMFSRIFDIENFCDVVDSFNEDDRRELYHRLGVLNVLCPLYPDRYYQLNLRAWDHRQLIKSLVRLAVDEPGDNLLRQTCRWNLFSDIIPGWTLPLSWMYDHGAPEAQGVSGGVREIGHVMVEYTSVGKGCLPMWKTRKELMSRFHSGRPKVIL